MNRGWSVTVLLVGAFIFAAAAHAQTFSDLKDYSGEELFLRFCAACHGESGHGDGPVASSLSVLVPDLTRISQRRNYQFPAAAIRDIIDGRALVVAHGPRAMPVWGYEFWVEEGQDVVAEQTAREVINRLVEYLQTIQVGPPQQALPR